MQKFYKSETSHLIIRPRWPYHSVFISEEAYEALVKAQEELSFHEIKLILTRGYENQGKLLRICHAFARKFFSGLFFLIYSQRRNEIEQIFSANGHTENGDCIDISIYYKDRLLNLLPYNVFTTRHKVDDLRAIYGSILDLVFQSLRKTGFSIHSNPTEAMQIHCEFSQNLDAV